MRLSCFKVHDRVLERWTSLGGGQVKKDNSGYKSDDTSDLLLKKLF